MNLDTLFAFALGVLTGILFIFVLSLCNAASKEPMYPSPDTIKETLEELEREHEHGKRIDQNL